MDELRKKITPRRWRVISAIFLAAIVVLVVVSSFFTYKYASVSMAILFAALALLAGWIAATIAFWRCPACGVILPARLIGSFASYCPYCGKRIGKDREGGCGEKQE